ncbi:MAG: hypothetical protein KAT17_04470 [Candidatus Aminicenantes bacterium]|nr:hypothetical protein [Candidatus Aminicenantes bacterium]
MKKWMMVIFVLILSCCLYCGSDFKFEKELTVFKNTSYESSLISLGGNIEIKGCVEKSVIMIGGFLHLDGEVKDDVVCFGSDVKIGKNALINGDLLVIGGELNRDALSNVKGEFFYFRFDLKKIESTLIPIISDAKTITFIRILKIIFWLILSLIVLAIVPQKISQASEIFDKNILKTGLFGLLSIFSFLFFLLIFIILTFLIIGIPLLLLLVLAYFVILIFGRTVMFFYIGSKISNTLGLRKISPSVFLLIGVGVYTLLKFLPFMGLFLLIIMNIFEIGIGISFFLKKKLKLKP